MPHSGARVPPADPAPSGTDDVITALLALKREAGTTEAAEARRLLSDHLQALGFRVDVQRFAFSTGTLNALPVFGAGLGWLTILMIPLLLMAGAPSWASLAAWVLGLSALATVACGIALGWAPARGEQREDANLIVRRPDALINRWIVAHVDTKAQRQSMAGRLLAVAITVLGILLMLALAITRVAVVPPVWLVAAASGLTLAASVLCSRGRLKGRTVGAADNGSGLVAALVAAETSDDRTGFIFTGAEEFGLVGARILAQQTPELVRGRDVVNVDTIDDVGIVSIVSHDRAGVQLAGRLEQGIALPGTRVRRRRLLPGIMVDSQAFARADARAVTLARLDWGTLRRLHTARDARASLTFDTARALGAWLGSVR
ncbi:MAG TPA: M28 family peptidase [Gemmatimonadales bacterium]|nr:M28 family peptidase [Gemmatimonadales bacterium]